MIMTFRLDDHVAVVTGSSKGLGKAIAMALASAGAKVAINCFNDAEAGAAALRELEAHGARGTFVRADATTEAGVGELISAAERELGEVDIVVINATCAQPQLPIEEYTWQHYQAMIDCFIKSPYLLVRRTLAKMKERRWGRIINIGTEAFVRGMPNFSAYVAAKGGQVGLTRSLATELAPFQITVNLVAPGWIPVERHADDPRETKEAYLARVPMGRWGEPRDIGAAVLYLASEEASFVTGQSFCVNGGLTVD